ncbi:periplasmic heavy metal sensor [Desulfomicrobium escambiense]|uniref:periplasmic heavy metal sensor n=1 Tax=Desulfomicrobium escambiense TaxID=29503 RepID=UPI0004217C42|nr:periplasmic heavy metal sensor [Desulfomicrobium escambiense]
MKRTSIIATLAIVGIIAVSSLGFAGPMRGMGGRGDCQALDRNPAVAQLTQEKQDLLKAILDEHRKETQPLRDTMWEKRTLLKALSGNPNTKPEAITALVREMGDLRGQLHAKRDALEARVQKEVGINLPMGFGHRDGHRGMGGRGQGDFGPRGMGGYGQNDFGPRGMGGFAPCTANPDNSGPDGDNI